MSNMFTPINLLSYKPFDELEKWVILGDKESKRGWIISNHRLGFRCCITWEFRDNQLGAIDKYSKSGEEAVYLALEEFSKWEKANG